MRLDVRLRLVGGFSVARTAAARLADVCRGHSRRQARWRCAWVGVRSPPGAQGASHSCLLLANRPTRAFQIYANSYACSSHARNSASTSLGVASGISRCQRFAEVCSARRTRGLSIFLAAFRVRTRNLLRVATPANADERTRWIEVFLASSRTGPRARAADNTAS